MYSLLSLHEMSVRKTAPTNDGHLGYTDTLNEIWDQIFCWLDTGWVNSLLVLALLRELTLLSLK